MRAKVFFSISFLLMTFVAVKAGQINWLDDLKEAQEIAQRTGKPLLLDFTAVWCGPCRSMESEFWTKREVIELSKSFVCVKIDSDKNAELRQKYSVKGIPFIALTDYQGNILDSQQGYIKTRNSYIIDKFKAVLANYNVIAENEDIFSLAEKANSFQQNNNFEKSNSYFIRILEIEKDPKQIEIILVNIGFNYLSSGDISSAEKTFEKIREDFPKGEMRAFALYGEICIYADKGDIKKAETLFDKLRKEFPRSSLLSKASLILSNAKLLKQKI